MMKSLGTASIVLCLAATSCAHSPHAPSMNPVTPEILALLLMQVFSTFAMTGIIWLVQWVHYPTFRWIESRDFARYHHFHSDRITWIVAPVMVMELGSSIFLCRLAPDVTLAWVNVMTVVLTWLATGLVSVPLHNRLGKDGMNHADIHRLIVTNWLRTGIWSLRSAGLGYFLWNQSGTLR